MKRKFLLFLICLIALPASRSLAINDVPDSTKARVETRIPQPPVDTQKTSLDASTTG